MHQRIATKGPAGPQLGLSQAQCSELVRLLFVRGAAGVQRLATTAAPEASAKIRALKRLKLAP